MVNHSIALFISLLSLSSLPFSDPYPSSRSISGVGSPDIHDILPVYNIPKGILPNAVKSYSFSSEDGSFSVEMENTCYVKFADGQLVYYDRIIKGELSYGKISQVSGIQAKRFLWVPVTGLDVDSDSDQVPESCTHAVDMRPTSFHMLLSETGNHFTPTYEHQAALGKPSSAKSTHHSKMATNRAKLNQPTHELLLASRPSFSFHNTSRS
ncbi:hypothetical protein Cgig2_016907 [Carnegiea gigantea]|uniref:Uncharacterized protein n=1 Tax=Carnegiea gigantea TaxID=171969 RepID=A0A9Q1K5E0_9CARY|nr:hypothetical protein Cgig2_016907 [Carnegiea gigantea]